jgi:thermolysin
VKKFLGILAVFATALFVFGVVSQRTGASKAVFGVGKDDERELAKQISRNVLKGRAAARAIGNPDEYKAKRVEIDELKMAHTHFQQFMGDVPVWEGEAIVHLESDGQPASVTDELKDNIAIDTTPNLSKDDAIAAVKREYRGWRALTAPPEVDLWIYRGEDRDHLAYRIQLRREDGTANTSMPVFFIDAHTGDKVFEYDNLQTAGTGSSLYSGSVSIDTSGSGTSFYMEDTVRKQGTFNMNNTGDVNTGTGGTQSRYTDTDNIWNTSAQQAGVDAHYGAAKTFDYYQSTFGRNGIDGNYGPGSTTAATNGAIALTPSRVHFGSRYNNAFWNGSSMTYGDGDGTQFTPLVTLDIAGHEMTHGVTERTAGLTYSKESGALNEAISDIFGSMVERYARGGVTDSNTWKIGEQAYTPGTAGDALRRMDNPNAVGDPDHYSLRLYSGTCTPSNTNDQCGVHTNSSIVNHTFYLIAAGGTNRVSGVAVPSIGPDAAAKIFYRALTVYMTSGTTFSGARTATLNAATDLYGSASAQYTSVATGWCAVGVGACPSGGGTPTPTPTPTPTGGSELLVNGGFETSASPWVGSGTGYFYVSPGNYPHGGTGYIYFGVNNSVTGQSYQQVTIPSTAAGTLTYWLNVTSSETTTTTQYDKLFVEVRNTAGTLLATLATYSNLNKGTAGVYSQKSVSLAAYRGQTVRVQFRSTTDSSVTTTFRVDDVSLK